MPPHTVYVQIDIYKDDIEPYFLDGSIIAATFGIRQKQKVTLLQRYDDNEFDMYLIDEGSSRLVNFNIK